MSAKIILPRYTVKLPSTGKSVQFRPYTVKEEKAILLALQEANIETMAIAIKNVVSICSDGKLDPDQMPYYDVEYLFLQIRSKSVGEVLELIGSCDCDPKNKTEFSVDIATAKVEPTPSGTKQLKIVDTQYTIEFRHPSIDDIVATFNSGGDTSEEVVANCIVKVYTDDEVMDWSKEEKLEFVESMTSRQQKNIAEFLQDMPMVKLSAPYTCRHCSKEHINVLSGFENFFV